MEEDNNEFKEPNYEAKEDIREEVKEDILREIKKPGIKLPTRQGNSFNWWILGTLLFFVLFLGATFTGGFSSITGMSAAIAGENSVSFLNDQLLPPGTEAALIDAKQVSGVYSLKLDIGGEEYESYVTKDGKLFFISGIELTETTPIAEITEEGAEPSAPAVFDAPDEEKPLVQLFVMSYCPYGQQAENNIVSVIELLSKSIDFEPRFIVNIADGTAQSLHGTSEADEDMRQACIWKYYPESWWNYVMYVNERIPLNNIDEQWTEAAEAAEIDVDSIETCIEQEGLELLQADYDLTAELGVTGSPTLIINGQTYSGQRTSEAYKQAICSGFEEQPEACSEVIEEEGTAANGSC